MDIKPGSYPNSINIDNNGVVTVALEDIGCKPDTVYVYLEQTGVCGYLGSFSCNPEYVYVDDCIEFPYPVYIVKFPTQDLVAGLNLADCVNYDNLCLKITFSNECCSFSSMDSIRIISNK